MKKMWAVVVLAAFSPLLAAEDPVSFQKQIKPILARQCTGCHQPASRQSELLLTTYDGFQKGGRKGPAFVAGKPDESVVIGYLTGKISPSMPFGGKQLATEQIDLFKRWILEGAKNDAPAENVETTKLRPAIYYAPPLITALAYSPDGKILAISGYREILLHDGAGGLQARLQGLSQRIHTLAFSPDGKTLVGVGGDPGRFGEVQIWDLASRKQRKSVVLTTDTLSGADFSPDGTKLVFCAADKSVRMLDVETGKEIRKMDHHEDWVFAAVFGIDGKRIVSVGRDRAAKLIDASNGQFIENVNLLKEPLAAIARHPKKDWVLVGGQERVPYLYRMDRPRAMRIADDSTLIRKFEKQDGPILAVAISADGQYAAVGTETGDVHIYNMETGERTGSCGGHQGGIYSIAFQPDGKSMVTAGFDGTVRIYSLDGKMAKSFVPVPLEKKEVAGAR
jgi:Tol biopolymer transport system component